MNFKFHQDPYSYFQSAIVTFENEAQLCVLNQKQKEKNIITNSFLSNAEYEVSSFFCNISQK